MKKTFNIGFIHGGTAAYDFRNTEYDETQFTVEYAEGGPDWYISGKVLTDLLSLWTDFLNENNFDYPSIEYVEETEEED